MPRSARLDAPGTLHHVIIRGIERRKIVDDDQDRQVYVDQLGQLSADLKTPVYAWALMTNHAHLLIRSGPEGLPSFMRKLLTGYGKLGDVVDKLDKLCCCLFLLKKRGWHAPLSNFG